MNTADVERLVKLQSLLLLLLLLFHALSAHQLMHVICQIVHVAVEVWDDCWLF